MVPTLTSTMLEALAPEFGVKAWVEPTWRTFGYLELPDGSRRYWSGSALDLNTVGAAELSRDKAYTSLVLRQAGIRTPKGHAFGSKEWCDATGSTEGLHEALRYAQTLGYPVFVKPNSSQGGRLVFRAHNDDDLSACLRTIFAEHKLALVEESIVGTDARLLVLDGEVVLAYERHPLMVTGDGEHSIRELAVMREEELTRSGRPVRILAEEGRIVFTIVQQGAYTLRTVLPRGATLVLLPSANLATGGTTRNITDTIHAVYKDLAVRVTQLMHLRFAGIDIMKTGESAWQASGTACVLEVNGKQPAITHFAQGHEEEARGFYRKLLHALLK